MDSLVKDLFTAIKNLDIERLNTIVLVNREYINLNSFNDENKTPLMVVADMMDLAVKKYEKNRQVMVAGGVAGLKGKTKEQQSAMIEEYDRRAVQIFEKITTIFRVLLRLDADPGFNINNTESPLLYCSKIKNPSLVELLIDFGAKVNNARVYFSREQKEMIAETPLTVAIKHQNVKVIELLLKNRADATFKDMHGLTILDLANATDNPEVIKLITEKLSQKNK